MKGSPFMARRKTSGMRPCGMFTSSLMERCVSPSCLKTAPLVVKWVEPSVASTGLRMVFPLVPSTRTSNLRAQRDAVAGALETEIRDVGFAARGDGIQFPLEASLSTAECRRCRRTRRGPRDRTCSLHSAAYRPAPRNSTVRRSRSCESRPAALGLVRRQSYFIATPGRRPIPVSRRVCRSCSGFLVLSRGSRTRVAFLRSTRSMMIEDWTRPRGPARLGESGQSGAASLGGMLISRPVMVTTGTCFGESNSAPTLTPVTNF